MVDSAPANALREVEEGRHDAGIVPIEEGVYFHLLP